MYMQVNEEQTEKLAEVPEKLAEVPEKQTELPEEQTELPEEQTESLEKQTKSPEKLAESPVSKPVIDNSTQIGNKIWPTGSPEKSAMSLEKEMKLEKSNVPPIQNKEYPEDPQLGKLIQAAITTQKSELNFTANETHVLDSILKYREPCLQNKYCERPLNIGRSHGGVKYIDMIQQLTEVRALQAFELHEEEWGCNVLPYSRSLANLAVYTALCKPNGRLMGLDVKDGSDYTHGCTLSGRNISFTDLFFQPLSFTLNHENHEIDCVEFATNVRLFKPKVITVGVSSYPRILNYKAVSIVATDVDAYVHSDISEMAGLVAAGEIQGPFMYSDVVTAVTHMTMRGPHGGLIFYRKGGIRGHRYIETKHLKSTIEYADLGKRIAHAVNCLQDTVPNDIIAAKAAALKQVNTARFIEYQRRTRRNIENLYKALVTKDYRFVTDGTDLHYLVMDLLDTGIDAEQAEKTLGAVGIICSRCPVPNDDDPFHPHGLKLGIAGLTSRKLKLCSHVEIHDYAQFINRGLFIARKACSLAMSENKTFDEILKYDKDILEDLKDLEKKVRFHAILLDEENEDEDEDEDEDEYQEYFGM